MSAVCARVGAAVIPATSSSPSMESGSEQSHHSPTCRVWASVVCCDRDWRKYLTRVRIRECEYMWSLGKWTVTGRDAGAPGRIRTCGPDRLDLVLSLNTVCHNAIHDRPPGDARCTVTCRFWAARRAASRRILPCSATASSSDISPVGGGSGGNSGFQGRFDSDARFRT